MRDRLLTPRDAQRKLGIPAGWVHVWFAQRVSTGLYPKGHANREPLFLESELRSLKEGRSLLDEENE
jgi:hypothetical protein